MRGRVVVFFLAVFRVAFFFVIFRLSYLSAESAKAQRAAEFQNAGLISLRISAPLRPLRFNAESTLNCSLPILLNRQILQKAQDRPIPSPIGE